MLKILCVLLLLPVAVFAQTVIPEELAVPNNYQQILMLHAKGQQIYQCTSQQGAYSWQLQKPDAQLFDTAGHLVGHHSAGPTWYYQDGSRVLGRVINKLDVTPDSAVSWLLLEVIEHHGTGVLTKTHFIQRINTRGGLPPTSACDSNHLGLEKSVPYSSDYIFS